MRDHGRPAVKGEIGNCSGALERADQTATHNQYYELDRGFAGQADAARAGGVGVTLSSPSVLQCVHLGANQDMSPTSCAESFAVVSA